MKGDIISEHTYLRESDGRVCHVVGVEQDDPMTLVNHVYECDQEDLVALGDHAAIRAHLGERARALIPAAAAADAHPALAGLFLDPVAERAAADERERLFAEERAAAVTELAAADQEARAAALGLEIAKS